MTLYCLTTIRKYCSPDCLTIYFRLSCKCNWLTIPKILTYDRVDFVCPTLKVAVKLLDGYSRPGAEMNENLFRRKWPGTVDGLRSSIKNGSLDSFCDPDHGETSMESSHVE